MILRIPYLVGMFVLFLLASSPLWAAVYTWTDANGNKVFSDQPHPDGKSVELGPVNTIAPTPASSPSSDTRATSNRDSQQQPQQSNYRRLAITSPANDEPVRANDGNLTLTVETDPPLQNNHLLRAEIDGSAASPAVPGNGATTHQLMLNNIDRGSHSVTAVIIDARGQVLQRSGPLEIHLQRTSLNQPARAGANQAPQAPAAPRAPNVPAPSGRAN